MKALRALGTAAGILWPLVIVALICGMAMYVTGRDNACTAAGGRLEFSDQRWSGEVCVRDGTDDRAMIRYLTAQEVADMIRRPIGTVYRWASTYGWRKADNRRPVLYAAEDVEKTLRTVGKHADEPSKLDATCGEA